MTRSTHGPVFVGGAERTGTSLMFALLTSHPNIAMTRRTNFWRYIDGQFGDLSHEENLNRCLETMRRYKRFAVIDIDWDRLRSELRDGHADYGRLYELLQLQQVERESKARWGDKSLMNERYAERIFEAYPDARLVQMLRDPRDRYASVLTRWKTRRGGIGAGMAEWFASVRAAENNQAHWPDMCLTVRYEDLVSDPSVEMQRVCEFIGEPFVEEMLSMQGAERFRREGANSSYGKRAPGAISATSVGRYTQVLSRAQVEYVDRVGGEVMKRHGYEPDERSQGVRDRLTLAALLPFEELRRNAWQTRSALRATRARAVPDYRLVDIEDG